MARASACFFTLIFVHFVAAQFTGGLNGPCSATSIPGPFGIPVNVFGNTGVPGVSNQGNSLCTSSTGPAIWYSITPDNTNFPITISTCTQDTTFDTIVSVYSGSCNSLTCLSFNDDDTACFHPRTSSVTITPTAQTFYISVGGFGSATGIFQLSISQSGSTLGGTTCSVANPLPPPYVNTTVSGSTNDGSGYNSLCTSSVYPYIWYSITPSAGVPVTITTCSDVTDFDTVLALFNSCTNSSCLEFNDDYSCFYGSTLSTIEFTPSSNSTLYIAIGGYSGHVGDYELTISQAGRSATDACQNAIPAEFPGYTYGSTLGSTPLGSAPCGYPITDVPNSWFSFTSTINGNIAISTCNFFTNFDTVINVYSGSCASLACVDASPPNGCTENYFGNSLAINAAVNVTYYVVVTGEGDFLLQIESENSQAIN